MDERGREKLRWEDSQKRLRNKKSGRAEGGDCARVQESGSADMKEVDSSRKRHHPDYGGGDGRTGESAVNTTRQRTAIREELENESVW